MLNANNSKTFRNEFIFLEIILDGRRILIDTSLQNDQQFNLIY